MSTILLSLLLTSLWTAAWLHWIFDGEIRQFLFAYIFPESWRGGRSRDEVLLTSGEEFTLFVSAESQAPAFFRGLASCPGCVSNYVALAGLAFAFFGLLAPALGWFTALVVCPLIWAPSAWIGHRLHNYL